MKVCQQRIHHKKTESRHNEESRFRLAREKQFAGFFSCGTKSRVLQCTHYRRANRQNAASRSAGGHNTLCSLAGDFIAFAVHHVAFQRVAVNRLKSAETHIQRYFADLAAAVADLLQNLRSEMQPRRRGGNGARAFRENSLVSDLIEGFISTVNVRRQRYVAEPLQIF